jgi:hypothetical protein
MRRFLLEHSLSLALIAGWIVCSLIAWSLRWEESNFTYDWWLSNAGGFFGSAILIVLARKFWEKDSDPATPPPELEKKLEQAQDYSGHPKD